jgi:hypothetical protein
MALAVKNMTCDIYRTGRAPPQTPDVAGVQCFLIAKGQSTLTTQAYTHVMLVDSSIDIRDDNATGNFTASGANADSLYVPNQNGSKFVVILVRRIGRGTALDQKQVLLKRTTVNWPSSDV